MREQQGYNRRINRSGSAPLLQEDERLDGLEGEVSGKYLDKPISPEQYEKARKLSLELYRRKKVEEIFAREKEATDLILSELDKEIPTPSPLGSFTTTDLYKDVRTMGVESGLVDKVLREEMNFDISNLEVARVVGKDVGKASIKIGKGILYFTKDLIKAVYFFPTSLREINDEKEDSYESLKEINYCISFFGNGLLFFVGGISYVFNYDIKFIENIALAHLTTNLLSFFYEGFRFKKNKLKEKKRKAFNENLGIVETGEESSQ